MKKKILIGSIIAVVLLTLVSFSSVVGYSSVKSDSKIASPLFGVRTNRAINKEADAVTSDYIGKGKAINILLPRRNSKVELVEKFVNIIKWMDEKSLDSIADIIFHRLESDDNFDNIDKDNVKEAIYFVSENPKLSKSFLLQDKENSGSNEYTYGYATPIECIFALIYEAIIVMFIVIFVVITYPFSLLSIGILCDDPFFR